LLLYLLEGISSEVLEIMVTQAASSQTEHAVAASPINVSQDLDTGIRRAAHQIQLIEYLAAHQKSIKYASYAVEEALRGKQSNRLSSEDVSRRWLHTAEEEIEIWVKRTKQMVEEVESARKKGEK
jgi:hypothetical protein